MTPAAAMTMWVLFFGGTVASYPNNTQEFYSYESCRKAELKLKAVKKDNLVDRTFAFCTEK